MANNILDLVSPAELTAFAREVPEAPDALSLVLPNAVEATNTVRVGKAGRRATTAKYRSYDAEAPIGRREGFAEVSAIQLPPISEKYPLNESAVLDFHKHGQTAAADLIDSFYDDAEAGVISIRNRAEKARGQFLAEGKITLNENNIVAEADFGLDPSHAPNSNWSAAGADIIADEAAWVRVVRRDAQEAVKYAVVSPEILDAMLKNENYRSAFWGAAASAPTLSHEQLNQVRASFQLPQIVVYDGEVPADTGTDRVLPANKYILATAGLGRSVWGLTAEGIELAGSNAVDFAAKDAPGIVVTQWRAPDPVTVWTKAASVFLPVADDIDGLLSATITLA